MFDGGSSIASGDLLKHEARALDKVQEEQWKRDSPSVAAKIWRCTHAPWFENCMAVAILVNFVMILAETDMIAAGDDLPLLFPLMSWMILLLFLAELGLRLFTEKRAFFNDAWNSFDFLVIGTDFVFSLASLLIDHILPVSLLRVLRLTKIARVSKLFRFFPELRLMFVGLMGAIRAMIWGTILLALFLLVLSVVAVIFIQPLNEELAESGVYEGCERCGVAFSTVMGSCLTFTQQILAGDSWGLVTIPIIEAYPVTAVYFIGVFMCVSMAILNLILGVVVDVMLQARKQFAAELEAEVMMSKMELESHLLQICRAMDTDASGQLSRDELMQGYDDNELFRTTLTSLGVSKEEISVVWISMDSDKSGAVSYAEFVSQLYSMHTSDTSYMLAYVKFYITVIKDELKMCMGVVQHDMAEELGKMENMQQVIHKMELHEGEQIDFANQSMQALRADIHRIIDVRDDPGGASYPLGAAASGTVGRTSEIQHDSDCTVSTNDGLSVAVAMNSWQQQRLDDTVHKIDAAMTEPKAVKLDPAASCVAAKLPQATSQEAAGVAVPPSRLPEIQWDAGIIDELSNDVRRWRAELTLSINEIKDRLDIYMPIGRTDDASSGTVLPVAVKLPNTGCSSLFCRGGAGGGR